VNDVVRIVGGNNGGGCRIHCHQVNSILEAEGIHTVTFIPRPKFADELTDEKLTMHTYHNDISVFRVFPYLVRRRKQIDYVHLHLKNVIIIYGFLLRLLGIKYVATVHQALEFRTFRQFVTNYFLAGSLQNAWKCIAISEFINSQMQQIGVCSTVIYNASDEAKLNSSDKDRNRANVNSHRFIVGIVGELSVRKGILDLQILAKASPDISFLVFGEGPLEKQLKGIPNVFLIGYESDVAVIYSKIDVLLALSNGEPFGRVVTEAFAASVPVVGRWSGAFPELLDPKLLFKSLEEASKILEWIQNEAVRDTVIGSQLVKFDREFSIVKFRAKVLEVLA
jgi:glycosyltransferase involved in cell wall biosynthesis